MHFSILFIAFSYFFKLYFYILLIALFIEFIERIYHCKKTTIYCNICYFFIAKKICSLWQSVRTQFGKLKRGCELLCPRCKVNGFSEGFKTWPRLQSHIEKHHLTELGHKPQRPLVAALLAELETKYERPISAPVEQVQDEPVRVEPIVHETEELVDVLNNLQIQLDEHEEGSSEENARNDGLEDDDDIQLMESLNTSAEENPNEQEKQRNPREVKKIIDHKGFKVNKNIFNFYTIIFNIIFRDL